MFRAVRYPMQTPTIAAAGLFLLLAGAPGFAQVPAAAALPDIQVPPELAAQVSISVAGTFPANTSIAATTRTFVSGANGRVAARVTLLDGLGPALPRVLSGEADLAVVSTAALTSLSEEFALFDLPFFFNGLSDVERIQES